MTRHAAPPSVDLGLRSGNQMVVDFPLVLDAARELGVPLVTGAAAFQLVQLARALGHGDAEDTALVTMLMDWAARPAG